jgi:hypothetical protein
MKGGGEGPAQEGCSAREKAMTDSYKVRREQLLSLWSQRPDGKRTENDVVDFDGEMERDFPRLLNRRDGDPYQNLYRDLKGYIEERKRVL